MMRLARALRRAQHLCVRVFGVLDDVAARIEGITVDTGVCHVCGAGIGEECREDCAGFFGEGIAR